MKPRKPKNLENEPSVGALVYELNNYKKDLIQTKDIVVEEADKALSEVKNATSTMRKEHEQALSTLEDTTSQIIDHVKTITKGETGEVGKDGVSPNEDKIVEKVSSKFPSKEEIAKDVLRQLPENKPSLKVIQEMTALNPEEIVPKLNSASNLKELKLTLDNIDGLGGRLDRVTSDLARKVGYHGGGDTVTAGTNITITTNSNGSKVISATGGGTGSVTDFIFTNSGGFTGAVSTSTTTPTLSLVLQNATTTQSGQLTSTDWNTFNNKGSGTVTSVSGTANRITSTGGATPVLDISASYVGQASITTLGTITTGVWTGTSIAIANGGTGQTTASTAFNALSPLTTGGDILYGGASGAGTRLANGSAGQVLTSAGTTLAPTWTTPTTGTVTAVSVASANGFAGSSSGGATPQLTLTTTINSPVLAGNGTAISAATTSGTGSTVILQGSPTITTAALGSSTATTQAPADNSTKLATTAYVDNAVLGQRLKEAVKYASIAALPSIVYANGSSGVGATLTGVALAAISLDSSSPAVNDRVLIKNQVSDFQNGIYTVTATGSGIAVFVLTRATDFDQAADIQTGDTVFVTAGSTLANTTWTYNGIDSPTMGTTSLTFVQAAGPGSYTAGAGITITGTSIAITAPVSIALGGTNATTASITSFNNITGLSAAGTTGTTSTNLVFSTSPNITTPTVTTSLTMADAANIIINATTGTKIGTATTQKIGFYNSTPIVQPTGDVITALQNLGLGASLTVLATTITSRTLWGQTYDGSANVTGSLSAVGNITGGASSMTITAGTGNSRTLALQSTTAGGTATTFLTGDASQNVTLAGNLTLGASTSTITGAAGNMTIVAGTGNSRTMILQTTTSGGSATTALTLNADQTASFAASIDVTTSITTSTTSFTAFAGATTLLTIGGTGASASLFAPSTLDTTSSTTGAIRTSGGISAAKAGNIGTTLSVGTSVATGFTTTATAAGTTTMTITSTEIQYWTGTTTQTIKLPTTSVLAGARYTIVNQSTGLISIQSSGANAICTLGLNQMATFNAIVATPTTTANWSYNKNNVANANNGVVVAGSKRILVVTQSATPSMDTDNGDIMQITGLAQAITSMSTNLTGTPVAGDMFELQITDSGTGRALTFGASFGASTVALPTTTVASTMLRIGFQYDTVWRVIAVA